MAAVPNLDSSDPFAVLGLDPNDRDSLDKKVIKRAYKRLALKYHPDVATNKDSTSEEKKRASDQFAKINAAYETLLGKREGNFASSGSTSTGTGGWTPPHRRKTGESSYSSSSSYGGGSRGTSWEDFMPKYDDAQYDAGGDSFGAIFADLLAGAAGTVGSRGGAGIFTDFVEFLERNVDGYGGVSGGRGGDDAELTFLLQTGTVDEVGEELDDTQLVVEQLQTKLRDLQDELLTIQADLAASTRFSEKIALEEREAECNARKGVVENYLQRARKRLLALQTRYKQLIVGGANDSKAGGRSTSNSWSSSGSTSSAETATNSRRASSSSDPEDAWKTEGFGSSGRGRGSGRRRASRSSQRRTSEQTASTSSGGSRQYDQSSASPRQSSGRKESVSRPQPQPTQSTTEYNVPPHRRTGSYQAQDDKERLRQLKVDDEFDKLKKELGL